MAKRPCIRGLKEFKKGCPEKTWDKTTGEGCPAWRVWSAKQPGTDKEIVYLEDCVDITSEYWLHEALRMNETLIKTNESFRNGMCDVADVNGKVYPKPDRGVLALLSFLNKEKQERDLIDNNQPPLIIDN